MKKHDLSSQLHSIVGENEALIIDAFVVPGYLHHYWEAVQPLLLVGEAARVAHLSCLTGYPDEELLASMPETEGVGIDESASALAIARSKVSEGFQYVQALPEQTGLETALFSHVLLLNPIAGIERRQEIFFEASRLLYLGGQALLTLPLSSSFIEIFDLLSEYALKHDDAELKQRLELTMMERMTIESLCEELEEVGFNDIDFRIHEVELQYGSGREFLEDPALRLLIRPQLESWLDGYDLSEALEYVAHALDRYFSEETVEIGVKIAAFSARR